MNNDNNSNVNYSLSLINRYYDLYTTALDQLSLPAKAEEQEVIKFCYRSPTYEHMFSTELSKLTLWSRLGLKTYDWGFIEPLIGKKIGAGAYSKVYEMTDELSGLCVKLLTLDDWREFVKEVVNQHRLKHKGVPQIFGLVLEPMAIIMERHQMTLQDWVISKPPMKELLKVLVDLCKILQEFHAVGYCHNDIKPNNIMIDILSEGPKVTIIDVGLMTKIGDKPFFVGDFLTVLRDIYLEIGKRQYPWYAPKLFVGGSCGPGTDAFSLAFVISRVLPKTMMVGTHLRELLDWFADCYGDERDCCVEKLLEALLFELEKYDSMKLESEPESMIETVDGKYDSVELYEEEVGRDEYEDKMDQIELEKEKEETYSKDESEEEISIIEEEEDLDFYLLLGRFLNDLKMKSFPKPSLLVDLQRQYLVDIIQIWKRRMNRVVMENVKLKNELKYERYLRKQMQMERQEAIKKKEARKEKNMQKEQRKEEPKKKEGEKVKGEQKEGGKEEIRKKGKKEQREEALKKEGGKVKVGPKVKGAKEIKMINNEVDKCQMERQEEIMKKEGIKEKKKQKRQREEELRREKKERLGKRKEEKIEKMDGSKEKKGQLGYY
ncbi:uncharacterized protein [Palaemon carinicauda]|uniref:uncharacterized protein n=1 Tax=Palaemon carinicauda TaxID=392227 RepID=UPI0035B65F8D